MSAASNNGVASEVLCSVPSLGFGAGYQKVTLSRCMMVGTGQRGGKMLPQTLTLLLLELILTHEHRSHEFPHWGLDGYVELAGMCAGERERETELHKSAVCRLRSMGNLVLFLREQSC